MTFGPQDLQNLLKRTDLHTDFKIFLKEVEKVYEIEKIYSFAPILEGYEDANIRLSTDKGEFVLKIFANEKTIKQIESYVDVLSSAKEYDVPLPELIKGKAGYLNSFVDGKYVIYYFLTKMFNGRNFENFTPTINEIIEVTSIISNFNKLDLSVTDTYDSWGSKNLVREYFENEKNIPVEIKNIILPVVSEMKKLDTAGFSTSVIHGDLQRKHMLKNAEGKYCLLDLGCMRYDFKVYDLSIFLAWFCLGEDTWNEKEKIVREVVDEYTRAHILINKELESLPLLVNASYGAYLLRTSLLIKANDTSDETRTWYEKSKKMLNLSTNWSWKY